jgi:hypothetical protein
VSATITAPQMVSVLAAAANAGVAVRTAWRDMSRAILPLLTAEDTTLPPDPLVVQFPVSDAVRVNALAAAYAEWQAAVPAFWAARSAFMAAVAAQAAAVVENSAA